MKTATEFYLENDFESILDDMNGKSFLVVGGSGYFGNAFFEILSKLKKSFNLDINLISISRKKANLDGVESICCDISRNFELDRNYDFVIHAATPVSPAIKTQDSEIIDTIVNGTYNLINALEKRPCKAFLNFSSGAVYGDRDYSAVTPDEDSKFVGHYYEPQNPYRTGKRIAELMVGKFGVQNNIKVNTIRGFAFSGRHLPLNANFAVGNFVRDAIEKKIIEVKGNPNTLRSYLDSEDLVYWAIKILLKGVANETFNVGSDLQISIQRLAELVAEAHGDAKVHILNSDKAASGLSKYIPNIDKAKQRLGLRVVVPLELSIRKMFTQSRE